MTQHSEKKLRSEYSSSLISYTIGFVASIFLTLFAYLLVVSGTLQGWTAIIGIMILALIQCFVQLIFFLNLGKTVGPRWKLAAFLFMLLIVIIVAGGSLWIMRDLDYRMTLSPEQMLKYMNKETGL